MQELIILFDKTLQRLLGPGLRLQEISLLVPGLLYLPALLRDRLPILIVCDEPVSALDVSIQAQILNLLMDLQEQRGLTYMFITHNLSVVKHISNEIMVMYLGQCIEKASSRELFKNPLHPYTQALLDSIPVPRLQGRNRKRQSIKGEIVSPIDPAPGCRFAPRCPRATEKCMGHDIPLKNVSENHQVACVLFN